MTAEPSTLFAPTDIGYLDTATYGLPPIPTVEAMSEALSAWQRGSAYWIDDWDVAGERARLAFAQLLGVPAGNVAMIPAVSVGVGTVAASLTPHDHVVVPDDEFTSLLFPLLVAEDHGTRVEQVPFDSLPGAIGEDTTLVATSLVQMQTGRVAPLEAIVQRAREVGARVCIDATHGLPFVGTGGALSEVDFVVAAAYKHLLCPRGVGFLIVRPDLHDSLPPWNANWRAASDPYGRYFGGPLTLAPGAARFDVSLPWFPWLGGAVSLELIRDWSQAGHLHRPMILARDLAAGLGVDWGGASLVCVPVDDATATGRALDAAGLKAGFRGDGVRLSTHVYTNAAVIEQAIATLEPLIRRGAASS